ncbi:hypothetical protein JYT83_00885 [bacterium AH-315-F18]|nr:hypothetical protein [bacterium AH-315-F18]
MYEPGTLNVSLIDNTDTLWGINFSDVVYHQHGPQGTDPRPLVSDEAYVVENSSLIARLKDAGELEEGIAYSHTILCFKETDRFLEVVSGPMLTMQHAPPCEG